MTYNDLTTMPIARRSQTHAKYIRTPGIPKIDILMGLVTEPPPKRMVSKYTKSIALDRSLYALPPRRPTVVALNPKASGTSVSREAVSQVFCINRIIEPKQ